MSVKITTPVLTVADVLAGIRTKQTNLATNSIDIRKSIMTNGIMFGDLCRAVFDATPAVGALVTVGMISQDAEDLIKENPEFEGEILKSEPTLHAARRTGRILSAAGDLDRAITPRKIQSMVIKIQKARGIGEVDKITTDNWESGKSGIWAAMKVAEKAIDQDKKDKKAEQDRQEAATRAAMNGAGPTTATTATMIDTLAAMIVELTTRQDVTADDLKIIAELTELLGTVKITEPVAA